MTDIEIIPVAGYSDFGRNMTAVRVGREVFIFDMGVRLDRVLIHEDAAFDEMHPLDLQKLGAIPDDSVLKDVNAKVVAIILSHGHLDHIGATQKLAAHYPNAPIYGTPYTMRLIEEETRLQQRRGDRQHPQHQGGGKGERPKLSIPNKLVPMSPGETRNVGHAGVRLEFVHTTHSIAQTVFPVLHTSRGAILYGLDFKFDNSPVVGAKPDYTRLKELAIEGVLAAIVESTNAGKETKTPSETIARDMLRDFLFGIENDKNAIIVSTFSSHTARIKSICEFGNELGREVLLLGRSMEKYSAIAADLGLLKLPRNVRTFGYGRQVEAALKKATREKTKYLLVATGHQGEPGSLLVRMANRETPYRIEKDDQVIFSADVIPNPLNVANRYTLETKLSMAGARIIKGAHVSGHASREDHREFLSMLEPQHLFPAHGGVDLQSHWIELGERHGYALNDSLHVLRNHQRYVVPR